MRKKLYKLACWIESWFVKEKPNLLRTLVMAEIEPAIERGIKDFAQIEKEISDKWGKERDKAMTRTVLAILTDIGITTELKAKDYEATGKQNKQKPKVIPLFIDDDVK